MNASHGEPVLTKRAPDPDRDFRLTWRRFQGIRAWARWAAVQFGCPVYLVGSALHKARPRDVDIALIWPDEQWRQIFGPTDYIDLYGSGRAAPQSIYQGTRVQAHVSAQEALKFKVYVDTRLCPACWWPDADRMLLGCPDDLTAPVGWDGRLFRLSRLVDVDGHDLPSAAVAQRFSQTG